MTTIKTRDHGTFEFTERGSNRAVYYSRDGGRTWKQACRVGGFGYTLECGKQSLAKTARLWWKSARKHYTPQF